ncbi:hypothetical protein VIN7_10589 [Saccharomyces cerevisiae x Saccharomyces kudriavzevii VIN7]|uniref:Uncharacterized protein n=1 Tax=Saccharomyces cerevisiae x Saccharomyces kudriavzevii (strain VIN7) TaxID=1095631 RepID=H0H2L5_SACCK|nr:hypothetical protein VIN7_10589 [Saccharomyces cerevisiae x Saccharomyces kudriavzevii VIN7]
MKAYKIKELSIRLRKIDRSLSRIPKSMRRTSSTFYIHNINNLTKCGIPTNVTKFYWPINPRKHHKINKYFRSSSGSNGIMNVKYIRKINDALDFNESLAF